MESKFYIILHNIRSAHNVGSIFRTADGAGVEKIFLTGYSPSPCVGRKMVYSKAEKMIAKTALGAEKNVSWEKTRNISLVISKLRQQQIKIVALEQAEKSADYQKFNPPQLLALIVGNEVRGIDKKILDKCDGIIEIPMRGKKNSLNVAVALGIAAYEISGKSRKVTLTRNNKKSFDNCPKNKKI